MSDSLPHADPGQSRAIAAQKAAATVLRRQGERRAESLRQIQAQTADGTLVVRQMTSAEHADAAEAARRTRERNDARRPAYQSLGTASTPASRRL
jgi:hypothetical protein